MIGLEVKINGERICLAGAENLSVLNAAFTIGGNLGSESAAPPFADAIPKPTLYVGGLAQSGKLEREHFRWVQRPSVGIGDLVELRFVEITPDAADPPDSRDSPSEERERGKFLLARATYLSLKHKYEADGL